MTKPIYIVFILWFSGSVFGQNMNQVFEDTIANNRALRITAFNAYSTTSLRNEFISKFIYGGHIDSEIKARNTQKNFNAIGGEFNQKIEYFEGNLLPKRPNLGITFAVSDNNFVSGNYKPAIWNLAFHGNADYLNDSLDLSFGHFQYLHFQKYEIGVYDKTSLSFIRLAFISGNRSINYRLGNSTFYTGGDGENLFLKLNGEGYSTDSVSNYFSATGYGVALEINHNFIFENKKGNTQIVNFNLSNLGTIFWNKNTNYQVIDSSYHFDGINYNDLQNYNNYDINEIFDTLGIGEGTSNRRESLPIHIGIQKLPHKNAQTKLQSILGFKAILIPDYRPHVYAGVYYKPTEFMSFSSRLSVGGFGGFKAGINANFWIKNNIYIGLGTNDLIGIVSERYGFGKSANLTIQAKF